MTGVSKFNVVESPQRLKELMEQQTNTLSFAKVQCLYFWKIGEVETVRHLAVLMGKTERTIHRWFRIYREYGLEELLKEKPKTGRPKKIKIEQVDQLQQEWETFKAIVSLGTV